MHRDTVHTTHSKHVTIYLPLVSFVENVECILSSRLTQMTVNRKKLTNKANWADNALHFAWPLHKRTCSTESLAYLPTCALVKRSDLEHLHISDRPLQQLLTLHMYFAVAAAIPRRLFYPI